MLRILLAFLAAVVLSSATARAQSAEDVVWVQIEARPNLAQATDRARAYTSLLPDLNGFALGNGWYGIAVGPYRRADAETVLRTYKREGLIPSDSFIQFSSAFRQQFWPVGSNVLNRGVISPPANIAVPQQDAPATDAEPQVPQTGATADLATQPADETANEARISEGDLSADARKELQSALRWAGFYDAAIDGAFGRGTRNSMAAWQAANNFDVTGILTTQQREVLLKDYNAVFDGLGMKLVRDAASGIEMVVPTEIVKFSTYEPPFVHFDPTGELQVKVLFISQQGNEATLFGLYDIMQTLEIVPLEGPRSRNSRGFELTGANARIVSHTEASLEGDEIKGFTLIWPTGDEDRRTRVLAEMRKSFARLPGVLDAAAGSNTRQSIDLVAGLDIRKPKISRSGFFVTADGAVATTSQAVTSCGRITLDGDTDAELIEDNPSIGIAFLRPSKRLAPREVAMFSSDLPNLQSEVALAGFSYEGVLSTAAITFGKLADLRGLRGEENIARLALAAQLGDIGGPVLDGSGHVLGMLLPQPNNGQQLPADVSFALNRASLLQAAESAGLTLSENKPAGELSPLDLTARAQAMTVLVSCWE